MAERGRSEKHSLASDCDRDSHERVSLAPRRGDGRVERPATVTGDRKAFATRIVVLPSPCEPQNDHHDIDQSRDRRRFRQVAYLMKSKVIGTFLCTSVLVAICCTAGAGELTITRVFGPEVPTGPYKHPASMTELKNGDLYLVYYGGAGEYAIETAVFGSRLKKGETKWSDPEPIARDPFRSVGNGVIWEAPDGVVWLFYVVRFGETWSTSRVQVKISRDGAETWSDASVLSLDEGTMVRNRPIVLKNGDYLLPVYHETGHDPEKVGADSTSLFLRYRARKTTLDQDRARSGPRKGTSSRPSSSSTTIA